MEVSWAALPLEARGEGSSCLSQLLGALGLCLHGTSSSLCLSPSLSLKKTLLMGFAAHPNLMTAP